MAALCFHVAAANGGIRKNARDALANGRYRSGVGGFGATTEGGGAGGVAVVA